MSHIGSSSRHRSDINMSLDDVPVRDSMKADRHSPYSPSGDDNARDRRIFVSHIPFRYNWRDLRDEVKKMGFDVVYCELFLEENGKSKGCGVVELGTEAQAKSAVEQLDGYMWDEMRLTAHEDRSNNYVRGMKSRVRGEGGGRMRSRSPLGPPHGRSSSSRPYHDDLNRDNQLNALGHLQQLNQLASLLTTGMAGNRSEPDFDDPRANNIVFVSNIDYAYSWQRIKDLFQSTGRVRHVNLRTDGDGKSKGVATVEFDTHREAQKTVDMFNGHIVNGRPLRIHIYRERDRDDVRDMFTQNLPPPPPNLADLLSNIGGGGGGGGSGGASNPLNLLNTLSSLATLQQLTQAGSTPGVLAALSNHSKQSSSSHHYHDSRGHRDSRDSRDSRDRDDYRRRDERSRHDDRGRSSAPSRDYHHGADRGSSRDHGNMSNSADYHPYPSSSSRSAAPSAGGGRNAGYPRVFVRNLDWGMDWQEVQDVFKDAGEVMSVDILREPDGRSKGRATVTFRTIEQCYAAIDTLTGTTVRGRTVEVKLDHYTT